MAGVYEADYLTSDEVICDFKIPFSEKVKTIIKPQFGDVGLSKGDSTLGLLSCF